MTFVVTLDWVTVVVASLTVSPVVTRLEVAKPVLTYTLVDVAVMDVTLTAAAAAMRGMSASESMQMAPRTTRIVRAAVSRERAWCEFMGKAKEHICRRDRI